MTGRTQSEFGVLPELIRETRDGLAWIEEALATLQQIAGEQIPDDASPQLAYIVGMARIAVKEIP